MGLWHGHLTCYSPHLGSPEAPQQSFLDGTWLHLNIGLNNAQLATRLSGFIWVKRIEPDRPSTARITELFSAFQNPKPCRADSTIQTDGSNIPKRTTSTKHYQSAMQSTIRHSMQLDSVTSTSQKRRLSAPGRRMIPLITRQNLQQRSFRIVPLQ